MKTHFLARQAIPKILFILRFNYTGDNPCWVWLICKAPWPDEKVLFLKFLKICNSRNSQNSVWRTNLLPRQATAKILFLLHSTYTGDTPYQVWFNLDNFLIQSKITIIKIRSSRNSQVFVWKLNFLARQAIPTILFVLHSNYTGDTPYWAWLIWTAPRPD